MKNTHIQNIDELSGNEYTCGDIDGLVSDAQSFFDNAEEKSKIIKYSQREFSDMPTTLCTLYGPMNALATRTGRDFTDAERRELCALRKADKDYDEKIGGYTSSGCDTVRRWWNTHNPDNRVTTFAVDVTSDLGKKFFAKNFPVATSVRMSPGYVADTRDGMMNDVQWGKTTVGHCRMRCGMKFHDNYKIAKNWMLYEYPTMDSYLEALKNGYERPIVYAFFLDNELSTNGKKLVDYMRKGIWNGANENSHITRYEAAVIAKRLGGKEVWNGLDPNKEASKYEYSVMLNKAIGIPICTDHNRNQELTRKEAILMLP